MQRLPDWLKWLVVVLALVVLGALMLAVDDRASRVDMPDPDDTFGIYQSSSVSELREYTNENGEFITTIDDIDPDDFTEILQRHELVKEL